MKIELHDDGRRITASIALNGESLVIFAASSGTPTKEVVTMAIRAATHDARALHPVYGEIVLAALKCAEVSQTLPKTKTRPTRRKSTRETRSKLQSPIG